MRPTLPRVLCCVGRAVLGLATSFRVLPVAAGWAAGALLLLVALGLSLLCLLLSGLPYTQFTLGLLPCLL